MTQLHREKATHLADLPHKYQGPVSLADCTLCRQPAFDARHVAWEKAQEDAPSVTALPRETGV